MEASRRDAFVKCLRYWGLSVPRKGPLPWGHPGGLMVRQSEDGLQKHQEGRGAAILQCQGPIYTPTGWSAAMPTQEVDTVFTGCNFKFKALSHPMIK